MNKEKRLLYRGLLLLGLFALWTVLIQTVDVQKAGETGTDIGFATWNCRFHTLTGVHMELYNLTDWLGLVSVSVCLLFGTAGFLQLLRRRSLWKVDGDILLLGCYYGVVIACYLIFERIPIHFRPILIEGRAEASYPSSTTLLVLSVMPTLVFQADRRLGSAAGKRVIRAVTVLFSLFMVIGRLISGVHWFVDIVGSVFLSGGLFSLYQAAVLLVCDRK